MERERDQLTDDELFWLRGLIGGWLAMEHNPVVVALAQSILRKMEGDKTVYVEDKS